MGVPALGLTAMNATHALPRSTVESTDSDTTAHGSTEEETTDDAGALAAATEVSN